MAGTERDETDSSSDPAPTKADDKVLGGDNVEDEDSYPSCFQCCVCLDLLYKPVVLACGHISCFWCVHKAMHGLQASHCALCRQPYVHFPSICQLLHHLLMKIEPVTYKRREKEVLEEERHLQVFSPQFGDPVIVEDYSGTPEEAQKCIEDLTISKYVAVKQPGFLQNGFEIGKQKQVFVDDALCAVCKELLVHPSVLNCGHVFCVSCLSGLAHESLKCPVCQSLHPGEFPNVCLDLDHFLEEQFPTEYAVRKEKAEAKISEWRHGESSSSASQEKKNIRQHWSKDGHSLREEDLRNVHVGVGCDSCGIYPLIGKRYKCKDCKEAIGFDLCEACYNSSSKLPGRFNQQHTPDHEFEVDNSQMLCRILFRSFENNHEQDDHPVRYLPYDLSEDHDDLSNDLPEDHDLDNDLPENHDDHDDLGYYLPEDHDDPENDLPENHDDLDNNNAMDKNDATE